MPLRYVLVSLGALAIDYALYLGLLALKSGISLAAAAAVGYMAGAVGHYRASRRFVFARKRLVFAPPRSTRFHEPHAVPRGRGELFQVLVAVRLVTFC